MHFHILSALIIINFIHSIYGLTYTIFKDGYNIAGSPMQFNVTASDNVTPLRYKFEFRENVTNSSISLDDTFEVSQTYVFPKTTKSGTYRLNVDVFLMVSFVKISKINGPTHIDFEIQDELNSTIEYNQKNLPQSAHRNLYVSCFNEINFASNILDFHHYYDDFNYKWFVNGTQMPNITNKYLNYTFGKEDFFNITALFVAKSNAGNLTTPGRNETIVRAYRALDSLKPTGIPNISWKRNKNLEIYINFINGSKPFWFCYQIFSDNKTQLICNDPTETFEDYFKVTKRFSHNGTYYLKIKAGNLVTEIEKSFTISVIDFEKKSQIIIFIIIPVVAFIIIFSILLAGILYYMSKRKKLLTEIADFNFETKSQSDVEVSLFQRVSHIFISSLKTNFSRLKETKFKRLDSSFASLDEET